MSKRQEIREKRRRQQVRQRILTIGLVAVAAVILVVVMIVSGLNAKSSGTSAHPMAKDNSMGNPDALVKVEEFSDFSCSHCRDFSLQQEPGLVKKYIATGKVYFTFYTFSFLRPQSLDAAEAVYCAMDQGKFWEYKDALFASTVNPLNEPFTKVNFISYAQKLGMDTTAFGSCLDTGKYKQRVQDDLALGKSKGVEGTPTFFVNGQMVYAGELETTIENSLKTAQ